MDLLHIPKKFNRCGLKIKCLKCKWQISTVCRLKGTRLSACEHKDKHRYNIVLHVPNTKTSRMTKVIDTKEFDEALKILSEFKEQMKKNGWQRVIKVDAPKNNKGLLSLAAEYLDALSGVNTPEHLIRIRSKEYVGECRKVIERFCKTLKRNGYNLNILELASITDREVELFHQYIKNDLNSSKSSYNKHFVIMKAFVNWVNKVKMLNVNNYFSHAELTFERTEKTIITKSEFEKLLEVTTPENGWGFHSGERRSYYKPWLKSAFRLAVETGVRAEELVRLKWNNIIEIETGVLVFRISNLKVNRIQTGVEQGKNIRYIPMTKSLLSLLNELGYSIKMGLDEYIIDRDVNLTTKYMMTFISRSFGHYIKKVTNRKIEFKDLRKTYITRISMVLGENTKIFTGHADNEVLKNHYISSAYLVGKLDDFDMFKTTAEN